MGEKVDRVVELSAIQRVRAYRRRSKTGKSVAVESYTRVRNMSDFDLATEDHALTGQIEKAKQDFATGSTRKQRNMAVQSLANLRQRHEAVLGEIARRVGGRLFNPQDKTVPSELRKLNIHHSSPPRVSGTKRPLYPGAPSGSRRG